MEPTRAPPGPSTSSPRTYGVSRATIRTALHSLDSRGLTVTLPRRRHVRHRRRHASCPADLHRLESISQTITRMGRRPGSTFRSITIREATEREAAALGFLPSVTGGVRRSGRSPPTTSSSRTRTTPCRADVLPRRLRRAHGRRLDVRRCSSGTASRSRSSLTRDPRVRRRGHRLGRPTPAARCSSCSSRRTSTSAVDGVAFSRTWFVEGRFQFSLTRVR